MLQPEVVSVPLLPRNVSRKDRNLMESEGLRVLESLAVFRVNVTGLRDPAEVSLAQK